MKKIALVFVGLVVTACGIEGKNASVKEQQEAAGSIRRVVVGKGADSLFDAMENSGIEAERVNGRIIIGAMSLAADTAHCRITMNATQDTECNFRKKEESFDVKDGDHAKKAAVILDQYGARTMHAIYGVKLYEASKLLCTRGNGPLAITRCEFEVANRPDDSASRHREISNEQARLLYSSLESAGVEPETVDGRPILGSVTLKADETSCKVTYNANMTKVCQVSKKGQSLRPVDASLVEGLIEMLEEQGAQINPNVIGASSYVIRKVECSMTVLAEPTYNCSFELTK